MDLVRRAGVILATLTLLMLLPPMARASDTFVVKKIEITGLQRISDGTLYDYLPINIGDSVNGTRIQEAIRALYKTGFFNDVSMRRDGDTLIVVVKERPSIAYFTVTGNRLIKSDDLNKSLQKIGLSQGQIFNRVTLDQFKQQLLDEYYSHGNYGVIIQSSVKDASDNRVSVNVSIKEGAPAKIRAINIVGNHAFPEQELRDVFKLKIEDFWSFWGSDDEYAREKLVGDLESLRSFYMDQGYADFNIDSAQVAISPDRNNIYITVNISEGAVYKVKSIKLAGQFVVPEETLRQYIIVKPGQTFSLKLATTTSDLIQKRLGVDGYAFARVNPVPDIDRKDKTVGITFFVDPGSRVYVRHINFSGASGTDEQVFRREMRQFEGTWLSSVEAERSRVRLERLPWVESAKLNTTRIPGRDDLVDLDFDVKERPGGTASIGLGYGSQSGFIVDGQITNANFMGSGERLSINASRSYIGHSYSVSFTDPYFTVDNVSRTLGVFGSRISQLTVNSSPFTTKTFGGQLSFDIPLSEYSAWGIGFTYSHSELFSQPGTASQIVTFLQDPKNGDVFYTPGGCIDPIRGFTFYCLMPGLRYNTLETRLSYAHDTRNRIIFPDYGSRESVSLTSAVPGGDLRYYILQYNQLSFIPLFKGFIYGINGEIDYGAPYGGARQYPPFKNFFAGGADTVRGWQAGTLGPYDLSGYPLGGRAMLYMQNELILPRFGSKDGSQAGSSRYALFLDLGNVFREPGDFRWSDLRMSAGIAATFLTPLGAMKFSYAYPLNPKPGDRTERFQFTLGTYY
ncbi:MAG TPA: outer membrane protein assembly factor BamA [Gammaproteobacteria bacterium]|nr:outer membrane protein assembly factor BamA [Gammaproteobacteria bacterium]